MCNILNLSQHYHLQSLTPNLAAKKSDKQTQQKFFQLKQSCEEKPLCESGQDLLAMNMREGINPLGLGAIQFYPSVVHSQPANL